MGKFKAILGRKKEIAKDIYELEFSLDSVFSFVPGQFAMLKIPHVGNRSYSIVNASENKVTFAIKNVSSTSNIVTSLPIGSELNLIGPFGRFIAHVDKPIVLIAGGIGITPLYSMAHGNPDTKMCLHFVAPNLESMAYLNELKSLTNLDLKIYVTKQKDKLTKGVIPRHPTVDDVILKDSTALYYICGPIRMIDSFTKCLKEKGVLEDNILSEEFVTSA